MTRDEVIRKTAEVLAGLQASASLGVPLGAARGPWAALHRSLIGFGWADADIFEEKLKEALG